MDSLSATSNLFISSVDKGIEIGRDVLIGNNVKIYDSNHGMNPNLPYRVQEMQSKKVIIGDGVWIGDNVIILPGVVIGNKSIVGAGSVVTKNIPEYTIVAGNPAKVIKKWENDMWIRI